MIRKEINKIENKNKMKKIKNDGTDSLERSTKSIKVLARLIKRK